MTASAPDDVMVTWGPGLEAGEPAANLSSQEQSAAAAEVPLPQTLINLLELFVRLSIKSVNATV